MKSKKKAYTKPRLTKFGQVRDLTQTMSTGTVADAMSGLKTCISPAPQIEEHRFLLLDQVSQISFQKAIHATVKPGDVVLDLGTGSGIHAFFACQAGAAKVYAVDSEAILEVARETAKLNGFADRIEFVLGRVPEIELPEKVDVIITNIGFLNTIQTLPEAAKRHLKPGGKLIPSAIEMQFTLVSAPKVYSDQVSYWDSEKYGLDFSPFKTMACNHPQYTSYDTDQLLTEPQTLCRMELLNAMQDFMENEIEFTAESTGEAHGLGGWYRFWNGKDLLMSTEPPLQLSKEIWTQIFLPFDKPLFLEKGDNVRFQIAMYSRGSYSGPVWRWRGSKNGVEMVDQCSFYATPLSKDLLKKLDPGVQ